MTTTDTWNPEQYDKFQREREQPFFDLLALVRPAPGMRVVDLGCGTGTLTRLLHARLQARETVGIDRSPRMLEPALAGERPDSLRFEVGAVRIVRRPQRGRSSSSPTPCFSGSTTTPRSSPGLRARSNRRVRSRFRFPRCKTTRRIPSRTR